MAPNNRPQGRQKTVTGGTASVEKRGSGLGTGPVGQGSGGGPGGPSGGSGGPMRSGGGRSKLFMIIILVVLVLFSSRFFGGGSSGSDAGQTAETSDASQTDSAGTQSGQNTASSDAGASASAGAVSLTDLASILGSGSLSQYYAGNSVNTGSGGLFQPYQNTQSGGTGNTSYTKLNTEVDERAREKRVKPVGGGKDIMTIMVYMCGTDLESKHGMATADMMEMAAANISDQINLLVYTGGCSKWQNNIVDNGVNQIYKVQSGGLKTLEKDMGSGAMTAPETLTEYIHYGTENYPADRFALIFWDHGGGTISGYGYDEKNPKSGSMTLAGIDKALKSAGTTFDFIGFDTCLMATLENALMLTQYADYMIASEETEPGVGWYYTNWLTKLSENTSMPTPEIGKNIIDDFVEVCNKKCKGQKTTLSLIDLAELEKTVPEELTDFAKATGELIRNDQYKTVSDARYQTREFAQNSKIDQVDLVDFAKKIGTKESGELADTIISAVKYNRTSSSISDAYGLSAYFPLKKMGKVDQAASIYDDIGMDSEYTSCIKSFASLQLGGQVATAGNSSAGSPLPSLLGTLLGTGGSSSASSASAASMINLFGSMLAGNLGRLAGADGITTDFLSDRALDTKKAESYIEGNRLDAMSLLWTENADGQFVLKLSEDQWSLVHDLDLNVFYDDGEGYIDLGLDNVFDYDKDGNLIGAYDHTWLTMNGHTIAYYHTDTVEAEDGSVTTTGYVPAFLNDERVKLIIVFDKENPEGYITGVETDYHGDSTETIPKSTIALKEGDRLEFICDYYSYDGTYQDSYYLGDPLVITEAAGIKIANMDIGEESCATYRLTDIYEQTYWTQVVPEK
ncbi:MAG: peptidase C11 [Lachnospiraceae bacterium]|nr:peptidase C11 [Lachnospiraceae bacterium]